MDMFNDRRIVLALIGGALALMAGLGIAIGMVSKTRNDRHTAPAASQGGLLDSRGGRAQTSFTVRLTSTFPWIAFE